MEIDLDTPHLLAVREAAELCGRLCMGQIEELGHLMHAGIFWAEPARRRIVRIGSGRR